MKTNLDKIFKADKHSEENGVWFEIDSKTAFLVRPFKSSNPRVKAAMAAHYKPYARQIEMGTLDYDKNLEINVKLFLDICLVDWRGVEIDGQEVEFSREAALSLMKSLPDLFDVLWKYANDFNNYKEDLGNS
jgi:hypothetical protein